MSKDQKEVKEVEKKEVKKEFLINLDYIEFIKSLIDSKIEVATGNKEEIEKRYQRIVKLKFNNSKRVSMRIKREEVKEKLATQLKKLNIEVKTFLEVDKKVMGVSNKGVMSNYL